MSTYSSVKLVIYKLESYVSQSNLSRHVRHLSRFNAGYDSKYLIKSFNIKARLIATLSG